MRKYFITILFSGSKFENLKLRLNDITLTIIKITNRFSSIETHVEKLLVEERFETLTTVKNLNKAHSEVFKCLEVTSELELSSNQLKKDLNEVKAKLDDVDIIKNVLKFLIFA